MNKSPFYVKILFLLGVTFFFVYQPKFCFCAAGDLSSNDLVSDFPDAANLLNDVLASLPDAPIHVTGQLQSKKPNGEIEKVLNVEMFLDLHASEPSARYIIQDAFGTNLEGLNILRRTDNNFDFRYFNGALLITSPLDDLNRCVQDTDITWIDLSLDFLWWPEGKTVGLEEIKGRMCYIVDLPAPSRIMGSCKGMRLWIDPKARMLLQVAAFGPDDRLIRLLQVKSFKKVKDVWMIHNIDVQTLPSRHKTFLRVRQVEAVGKQFE